MYFFKRGVPALPETFASVPLRWFRHLEFSLHHADDPLYNEGEYPLATGEKGKELLSYVPYYANHPLVQEAVRELEKLEEQQKRQKKQSRER